MKRILHISKYYYPFTGGVEEIAQDCVRALYGRVDQRVICFDHNLESKDSVDTVDGVSVSRVGEQMNIASQAIGWTYRNRLKEQIESFKPDIIIFHYPNPFVSHYLLELIPADVKLIIWWHFDIYKQKLLRCFFYHQNERLLKRADRIVITSPNYLEGSRWLKKARTKCTVIPNCIDENRLRLTEEEKSLALKIRNDNQGKIICLAVGRLVPYKGFEYLIKASEYLDDRFIIQIAGDGPLRKKLLEMSAGNNKVKLLGKVSDAELNARLMSCDIFTFSSITKNEGFGIALAEGMSYGHPAVTFTIPGSGVNYVNLNGETGIEVPNRNTEEYANAIKKLADDPELREKMGIAARERVCSHFLFSSFQKNVNDLINNLDD